MRRIIVPLDGTTRSERALRPAVSLAARSGCDVLGLVALDGEAGVDERRVADHVSMFVDVVPVDVRMVEGRADDVIVDAVLNEPDAAVCMATHARGELARLVLGSVAESVVHRSGVPVILVGEHCQTIPIVGERARMVVCHDGSPESATVVPVAATFAARARLDTWLVEVVQPDENPVENGPRQSAEVTAALDRLDELCAQFEDGVRTESAALHGADVARTIQHFTEELGASFIALATHDHSGIRRVALGSFAMQIVKRAPCPVMVVRA